MESDSPYNNRVITGSLNQQTDTVDFETFLDIYVTNRSGEILDQEGIEFRYTAACLLIACSKADKNRDPKEEKIIRQILEAMFGISETIINRLVEFGEDASEDQYLDTITTFVNDQFGKRDKYFLLEKLWLVAYADQRIEQSEERFINRVATALGLDDVDIRTARVQAQREFDAAN